MLVDLYSKLIEVVCKVAYLTIISIIEILCY